LAATATAPGTAKPDHISRARPRRGVGHALAFEVDDLQAAVDRLAADGYALVGDIGQYEHVWRMAYVRGPKEIIVSLAQRIG
jgi:hypothetical protein